MPCLFVCVRLFTIFTPSFFYPLPCVKIFFSLSSSLYLSVACLIDLFVSVPLMAPSFGSFVNTLGIIASLCETKKNKKKREVKMSSGLLNCFDEAIAEPAFIARVCGVCLRVCVWIESIGSPGSVLLPAQGGD